MTELRDGAAAAAVRDRMFAALAVLRAVLLANTVAMTWHRWDNFDHRKAALVVVAVAIVWSGLVTWLLASVPPRTWVFVVDLGLAVSSLLLSPVVKGENFQASLLGFWIAAPLLACAVRWRVVGGVLAGVLLGATDLLVRADVTTNEWGNAFLLAVAGAVVGYLSGEVQRMAEQQARAERIAAAAQERTRLSRVVHDGVLQVLAMVARRGAETGGDWAELGSLAGRQEVALRGLVHQQTQPAAEPGRAATSPDLLAAVNAELAAQGARLPADVHLSGPGHEVRLPALTVTELTAAVLEALANVKSHVGGDASAWVLVEQTDDAVVVSVRDEGPGVDAERLAAAEREGRLGVVSSIRGRITELGGVAELTSDRWGTEWEFTVPRQQDQHP